jgi:hypothetical protein
MICNPTEVSNLAANVVPISLPVPFLKSSEETTDSTGGEDGLKKITTPDVAPVPYMMMQLRFDCLFVLKLAGW